MMKNLVLAFIAIGSVICAAPSDNAKNKTTTALVTNVTTDHAKGTAEPPVVINNLTENVPDETTIEDTTPIPKPKTSTSSTSTPETTSATTVTPPTLPPPITPSTSPSTTKQPTPSTSSSTTQTPTTSVPSTTAAPHKGRHFDGPSFIGGIILATGLMAIGFVAFKFYRARTERNYHTL